MFDELVRQKIELAPLKGRNDLRGSENPDLYTSLVSDDVVKLPPNCVSLTKGVREREKRKTSISIFHRIFPSNVPTSLSLLLHLQGNIYQGFCFQEIYFHSRIHYKILSLSVSLLFPSPSSFISSSFSNRETDLVNRSNDHRDPSAHI